MRFGSNNCRGSSFLAAGARFAVSFLLLLLLCGMSPPEDRWDHVIHVIDGDTVELRLLGRTRLIGIDTPEVQSPYQKAEFMGEEASRFARERLSGERVRLVFEDIGLDRYGRLLAYLYLDDGRLFNQLLLEEGLAYIYSGADFRLEDVFRETERKARLAGRGVWSRKPRSGTFHGNTRSHVYHAPGCRHYNCSNCRRELETHSEAANERFRPHYQCIRSSDW